MSALRAAADNKIETSYLVRAVAVTGLGLLGKDTVIVELRRALEGDPSKEVRMAAVQAFVHAKEKAFPDLKKAATEQPNKEVRAMAVQALGAAAKEKALVELRKHAADPDKEIRLIALNTIAAIKDTMADGDKTVTLKFLNGRLGGENDPILLIWINATMMAINGKCDQKQQFGTETHRLAHVMFLSRKKLRVAIQQ